MWLWDANITRAFSDRADPGHSFVLAHGDRVGWDNIGIPIVVAGEELEGRLRYLAEAHRRAPRTLLQAYSRLELTLHTLSAFPLVPFDGAALAVYQNSRAFPGRIGRPDRLIAAIALAGQHVLVTRNTADFRDVRGLRVENWIDDAAE